MACEYREADRSKLEATSSYAGATADEIYIIDRAGEYSGPCFEHLIEIYMAIGRKESVREIVPVCSNCGEPISLTDSFCPHCSAEVVGNEFDC